MAKLPQRQLLIIIVIIMLILIVITLASVNNITIGQAKTEFPGTQSSLLLRDCDIETIYAINDEQCETICRPPGTFIEQNGACVNILALSQTAVENNCDPKSGVYAYLLGDPQFGTTNLICLSIDLGIQPDNPKEFNRLCAQGNISINYIDAFPQLTDCSCPENYILTTIPNTSTIRTRGICVNKKLQPVYDFNNLLYNNDNTKIIHQPLKNIDFINSE